MEKLLNEFVSKLQQSWADELVSVVLYGSAASGDYHEKFSDLNVLCVLRTAGAAQLRQAHPAVEWWLKQKQPPPLVLAREEISRAHEFFPIEFFDIQHTHRLLLGADLISALQISTRNYREQVERELRAGILRLRGHYLTLQRGEKDLVRIMAESLPTFATLARHALILAQADAGGTNGRKAVHKRDIFAIASKHFQFQNQPFETLLHIREGKQKISGEEAHSLFASYLDQITRLAEAVEKL